VEEGAADGRSALQALVFGGPAGLLAGSLRKGCRPRAENEENWHIYGGFIFTDRSDDSEERGGPGG
jgi:hypothetical protein